MKLFNTFVKLAAAVAAVGAIAYLVVKYFDAIKAWAEKLNPIVKFEVIKAEDEQEEIPVEEAVEEEVKEEVKEEAPAEEEKPAKKTAKKKTSKKKAAPKKDEAEKTDEAAE